VVSRVPSKNTPPTYPKWIILLRQGVSASVYSTRCSIPLTASLAVISFQLLSHHWLSATTTFTFSLFSRGKLAKRMSLGGSASLQNGFQTAITLSSVSAREYPMCS